MFFHISCSCIAK